MGVPVTGIVRDNDMKDFWVKRLKGGQVPEPKYAYVPVDEEYLTYDLSRNRRYDPENCWREFFGKHRCIACGKPFRSQKAAFDCHPEASAYIVWNKFASRGGPCCMRSLEDAIRAEISNPYGAFGAYGSGPYGL